MTDPGVQIISGLVFILFSTFSLWYLRREYRLGGFAVPGPAQLKPAFYTQETNMEARHYLVIKDHTSEFPEPITLRKGDPLVAGEKYEGPEGWDNWIFCESPGQKGGWVPAQMIEIVDDRVARAREDYTARELNVKEGDYLLGTETLNGWAWCRRCGSAESGWVPLENLVETADPLFHRSSHCQA
jgi:hypothetical protein